MWIASRSVSLQSFSLSISGPVRLRHCSSLSQIPSTAPRLVSIQYPTSTTHQPFVSIQIGSSSRFMGRQPRHQQGQSISSSMGRPILLMSKCRCQVSVWLRQAAVEVAQPEQQVQRARPEQQVQQVVRPERQAQPDQQAPLVQQVGLGLQVQQDRPVRQAPKAQREQWGRRDHKVLLDPARRVSMLTARQNNLLSQPLAAIFLFRYQAAIGSRWGNMSS